MFLLSEQSIKVIPKVWVPGHVKNGVLIVKKFRVSLESCSSLYASAAVWLALFYLVPLMVEEVLGSSSLEATCTSFPEDSPPAPKLLHLGESLFFFCHGIAQPCSCNDGEQIICEES